MWPRRIVKASRSSALISSSVTARTSRSSGRTGTRVTGRPVAARKRGGDGRRRRDRGRLADAVQALGRLGLRLEQLHAHRRHVEDGRDQVVGEAGILRRRRRRRGAPPSAPGRGPARCRPAPAPRTARGSDAPEVLRGGDLHHPHDPERGDRRRTRRGGRRSRAPCRVSLAGLGIQRRRGPVVVLDRLLHRVRLVQLVQAARTASEANGAAGHPALPGGGRRTGRADRGVGREHDHAVEAKLGAGDLLEQRDEALPHLGRRRVHLDEWLPAGQRDAHAGGGEVVEPLANPTSEAGQPRPAARVGDAAGSSRRSTGLVRWSGGMGMARSRSSSSRTGTAVDGLPGHQRSPRSALRSRRSIGSSPSSAASRSICASCATATWTAPNPAQRAARRRVGAGRADVDLGAAHAVRPGREAGGRRHHPRRRRRVRPAVEEHLGLHVDQLAVAGRAVLVPQPGGMAVHVGVERLVAGCTPSSRAASRGRASRQAWIGSPRPHGRRTCRRPRPDAAHELRGSDSAAHTWSRSSGSPRRDMQVDTAVLGRDRQADGGPRMAWSCIPTS